MSSLGQNNCGCRLKNITPCATPAPFGDFLIAKEVIVLSSRHTFWLGVRVPKNCKGKSYFCLSNFFPVFLIDEISRRPKIMWYLHHSSHPKSLLVAIYLQWSGIIKRKWQAIFQQNKDKTLFAHYGKAKILCHALIIALYHRIRVFFSFPMNHDRHFWPFRDCFGAEASIM